MLQENDYWRGTARPQCIAHYSLGAVGEVIEHENDDPLVGDAVGVEDLVGVTHVRLRKERRKGQGW